MKHKIFLTALFLGTVLSATAQNHKSVNLSVGVLYPNTMDATLSYEIETKYHNAWEFFADGTTKWKECPTCERVCSQSFWKNYRTWGLGVVYKPCVFRTRNQYGSFRIGASGGSNTDKFIGGLHVGYEHNYALKHGWRFFWQAKVDMLIPDREDLFRTGLTVGFKIPCGR